MLLYTEKNIKWFKEDLIKSLDGAGKQMVFEENRKRGQSSLCESELKELECLDENEKELKALGYYRRLEQEQKKIMSIWLLIINRVTSLTVFLSKVGLLMIFLLGVSLIERMSIVAVFALASYLLVAFLRIPFFFDLIFGSIIWAQPTRALLRRYKNFGIIEAKIDVTDPRGLHSFGKDKLIFDPSYLKSRI